MKRVVITAAIGAVILIAAGVALAPAISAQTGRLGGRAPDLVTPGPGSTIGVSVRDLRTEEAQKTNAGEGGAYIDDVREDTPAGRAGFMRGDIVIDFDGERVRSARHFTRLVRETPDRRTVSATVVRDGTRQTLSVTPEAPEPFSIDRLPDVSREIERGLRRFPPDFSFDLDFDPPDVIITGRGRLGATSMPMTEQ